MPSPATRDERLAAHLPQPMPPSRRGPRLRPSISLVLTGGVGRINRGLEALKASGDYQQLTERYVE